VTSSLKANGDAKSTVQMIGSSPSFCYDKIVLKQHARKGDDQMIPAKEEVRRLLDQLPDDTTLDDIQYHIYVRQKIDRGLKEIADGRTISEEEFDKRMAKWLEP
jgi:hypothetical protein